MSHETEIEKIAPNKELCSTLMLRALIDFLNNKEVEKTQKVSDTK